MGVHSTFTDEVGDMICDEIVEGKSLSKVCRENSLSISTVMKWLKLHEHFRENYTHARIESGHTVADVIGDIRQKLMDGEIDPQVARVAIDAAKWEAGRRAPKVYGDKLQVGGAEDLAPIRTQSTIDISGLPTEALEALQQAFGGSKDE